MFHARIQLRGAEEPLVIGWHQSSMTLSQAIEQHRRLQETLGKVSLQLYPINTILEAFAGENGLIHIVRTE